MIEIIPKPAVKTPLLLNILFFLSIILFLAAVLSYFTLSQLIKKAGSSLTDLEESLAREKTSEERLLEKEVLTYQEKIRDTGNLLPEHRSAVKVFELLEKSSHPKAWISEFVFDSAQSLVKVSGLTEDFQTLGQQLLLFREEPLVKAVNLSETSISEKRKIIFTIYLSLNPQTFRD